jgi:3-methyladenine DNA glycosylase AlkD
MSTPLQEIKEVLLENSDEKALIAYRKFVPGADKLFGVRTPILNKLAGDYKTGGFELAEQLWSEGSYEERQIAAKILGKIAKKDASRALKLIKAWAPDISDWATCDALGMQSLKPINPTHAEEIFKLSEQLIRSKNFWERRLALVLVEWYTRNLQYHERIEALLEKVKDDNEYYVKKAVVWIKKNFKKGK